MQLLHNDQDLVIERSEEVLAGPRGAFAEQSKLFVVGTNGGHLIDLGSGPSVSPLSDRIAYFVPEGIATINADGTERQLIAKTPRVFFSPVHSIGPIVWSPDGGRLFFADIESEDRSDRLFLLDLKSGKPSTFVSHTSIRVRGWIANSNETVR